jgi:hypothetical protein
VPRPRTGSMLSAPTNGEAPSGRTIERIQGQGRGRNGCGERHRLALATRFAAEGMKVVLADVEADPLGAAEASIKASGGTAIAVRTNVMQEAEVKRLADTAFENLGRRSRPLQQRRRRRRVRRRWHLERAGRGLAMGAGRQFPRRGAWNPPIRAADACERGGGPHRQYSIGRRPRNRRHWRALHDLEARRGGAKRDALSRSQDAQRQAFSVGALPRLGQYEDHRVRAQPAGRAQSARPSSCRPGKCSRGCSSCAAS